MYRKNRSEFPSETTSRRLGRLSSTKTGSYGQESESPARKVAAQFLQWRGSCPRHYANTLVFLAPDRSRFADLDKAVRMYLAWKSIDEERQTLNLDFFQANQARTKHQQWNDTVRSRIPECFFWLLVPTQRSAQETVDWQEIRLQGADSLPVRASKKLKNDGLLIIQWAPTLLRLELDKIPLWRGNHVPIKQLVEDFASYLYLPRLRDASVLIEVIREGLSFLMWPQESFAYAEDFDEATGRYRGLRTGQNVRLSEENLFGLLVRPEPALKQIEADRVTAPGSIGAQPEVPVGSQPDGTTSFGSQLGTTSEPRPPETTKPKRFHGTVQLDPARAGRDAGRVADEVVTHLVGLVGSSVRVTLEIDAEIPEGAPDNVVRTVTENSRTLKFTSSGFETE
jgi:hypothetical protein